MQIHYTDLLCFQLRREVERKYDRLQIIVELTLHCKFIPDCVEDEVRSNSIHSENVRENGTNV